MNLSDYERAATQILDSIDLDYIQGGAGDEITLRRARSAFEALFLRPRVLTGVKDIGTSTEVLGEAVELPVLLAPTGFHGRAHQDGELATAKAAADIGTVMVVSSGSSRSLEEVSSSTPGPKWFQQYLFSDRILERELAKRATDAGYTALFITLDSNVRPMRERDMRNGFVNPMSANYAQMGRGTESKSEISDAPRGVASLINRSATWADLESFISHVDVPVVAKGVMCAEDARMARECGAAAVVVSNHGARQVDTTLSTIEVLPEVVSAVQDLTVLLDGGIRRGSDVFKALALGASAVLIGRPVFWGLAVSGSQGVADCLGMLRTELAAVMGNCGVGSISDISGRCLVAPPS